VSGQPALFEEQPVGPGLDLTMIRTALDPDEAERAFRGPRSRIP